MFMNSIAGGMNLGFPDVCLTPMVPAPIPVPYPNISTNVASDPATTGMSCLLDFMPSMHMMTSVMISAGDEPGVLLGVVSHLEMGPTEFLDGAPNVLIEGIPATSMLGMTGQNGLAMNCPGTALVPTQVTVMTL